LVLGKILPSGNGIVLSIATFPVYSLCKVFKIEEMMDYEPEKVKEIEANLINAQMDQFRKGIIFWGAISTHGLIPSHAPINVTQWLEQQRTPSNDKRKRIYLTNQL
jgi:hypothetical protein